MNICVDEYRSLIQTHLTVILGKVERCSGQEVKAPGVECSSLFSAKLRSAREECAIVHIIGAD